MKVLVTGGSGFIGSNFIEYLLTDNETKKDEVSVVNLDALTYAGQGKNIEHMGLDKNPRYKFILGDICDKKLVDKLFFEERPEMIFNFAAESHVDRSIVDAEIFRKTNFEGAGVLLDTAIRYKNKNQILFIQISTDEVYGSLTKTSLPSSEKDRKYPRSMYAATKSGAEDLAIAAYETHGLPIIITRSANNYGPYQFPEKILPLFITNLIQGKKVPLMYSEENPGLNIRDWLHVKDNCRAIWYIANFGCAGEIYNIPGKNEITNIDLTRLILKEFGYGEKMIEKIPHRKGHDFRYCMDGSKLRELGFSYKYNDFNNELKRVIEWYKKNENWWKPLKNMK